MVIRQSELKSVNQLDYQQHRAGPLSSRASVEPRPPVELRPGEPSPRPAARALADARPGCDHLAPPMAETAAVTPDGLLPEAGACRATAPAPVGDPQLSVGQGGNSTRTVRGGTTKSVRRRQGHLCVGLADSPRW